jgi:hypothetical protein
VIAGACATLAVILLGLAGAPDDLPSSDANRVALVAPRASRLGQQLRRELQASGFEVEAVATATAAALEGVSASRAVVVDARGDRVRLLARAGSDLIATDQLSVAGRGDLALRRVALAVVEHLRRPLSPPVPATPPDASVTPQVTAEAAALAPEPPTPEVRRRPWSLGAATSLDLDGGMGESTGHLQLVGETALVGRLLGSVRLHWPLLGAQLHLPDRRVRLWTLAAAGGLRVRLPGWGKLQPLLGTTAGLRFVLTDTDWYDPRQSNVALAPALTAGAFAGARYAVTPLVHVALELGSEWSRPLGDPSSAYERDAASARATRVALGVVFEY